MQHKIVCFFTAQCMASDGIWGICFSLPIQVGALPQIGTKNIYCLKLDIQSCFHHLHHKNCVHLDNTVYGLWGAVGNMPPPHIQVGAWLQVGSKMIFLSKVHTSMFPSLATFKMSPSKRPPKVKLQTWTKVNTIEKWHRRSAEYVHHNWKLNSTTEG